MGSDLRNPRGGHRAHRALAAGGVLLATVTGFAAAALPEAQAFHRARDAAPGVSVPTVSVPIVPVPPVPVPALSVPSVSTPRVSTPSVPSTSVPSGPPSRSSHSSAGGPASAGSSGVVSGALGVIGTVATGAATSSQSTASGGSSSASRSASSNAARRAPGSDHRGGFTKRYLRTLLARDGSCLLLLPSNQANVLVLRTGLGGSRAYTRRQAARYLGVSPAREGKLERQAVSAVLASAKRGACSSARRANSKALFLAPSELALLGQSVPRAFISTAPQASTGPRRPARARHKRPRTSVSGASAGGVPGSIPSLVHPGASSFPWLFIILGLVAATALASPLARRRLVHHPGTAGARGRGHVAKLPGAAAGSGAATAAGLGAAAGAAGAGALASERDRGAPNGDRAADSSLGARLEHQGDLEGALAAYRRADAAGDAAGATNLGVLLEQRGDLDGALSAYRRADERGDANGSFNLGCLLADRGDVAGAVAALRRADERGDAAGASNLGVLLEQQGDLDGAVAAYRRADERGDANGSFNLGLLLAGRGDLHGAQEAYQRASERGDPEVLDRARTALAELREDAGQHPGNGGGSL